MPITVFLKKNEEKDFINGKTWVYANEVAKTDGKDKNGSLVTVRSSDGKFIGKGYINYLSKILVRLFIFDDEEDNYDLYRKRIEYADKMRRQYIDDDCYRVVFSESDYLPGLIVDKFHDALSVQFLTLGMDMRKDLILQCLIDCFNPRSIVERSESAARKKEGLEPFKGIIYGEQVNCVYAHENGLKLEIDLIDGQKTGYFLDQKLNRLAIRRYAKDKTVLDCFSNAGGFSLNAAKAGAKKIYALDISESALDSVKKNATLNGFSNIETVACDVFDKLREYKMDNVTFDMIILDPPAFCKSVNEINGALKGYRDINILAMKLLRPGGILVTSSCTHFISAEMFKKMLKDSAKQASRRVKLLEEKLQSPDHPSLLSEDESSYLKFFILQTD